MEVNRTIAGPPERTPDETVSKIFEMAKGWGAERMEIPIEKARVVVRPLVIDRTLQTKPIRVKFETHELFIFCSYEEQAAEIAADDEALPERLPNPRGELDWSLRLTVPNNLLGWAKKKITEQGIGEWCKIEGHMREDSQDTSGKKQEPLKFNEDQIKKSLGSE